MSTWPAVVRSISLMIARDRFITSSATGYVPVWTPLTMLLGNSFPAVPGDQGGPIRNRPKAPSRREDWLPKL